MATRQGRRLAPSAVQVLPANAPRELWLAERRRGVGSSDASAICKVNPNRSVFTAYQEKIGALPPPVESDAMWLGTHMEPVIARLFTRKTGLPVRRCGLLRSTVEPWQQYSPDRLVKEDGRVGPVEMKYHGEMRREDWVGGEASDHSIVQLHHGLTVTGWDFGYIIAVVGGNEVHIRRIERDPDHCALLTEVERRFWFDHVVPRQPPPVDGSASTTDTLKALYPRAAAGRRLVMDVAQGFALREQRDKADDVFKAARAALDEATNRWRALLGDAEEAVLPGGEDRRPLATWKEDSRGIRSLRFPKLDIDNSRGVA